MAPIARAIRVALAVSAATLAFSTPVLAANGCLPGTVRGHACDASAIQAGRDWPAMPFDLTRIDDGQLPASVVPAGGPSLVADNSSPVDVVSTYGDATAVSASDPGNQVLFSNSSSIHAAGYASAIGVDAYGSDVRIDNNGSIDAIAASSGGYVPAVGVRASGSDVAIYNNGYGTIDASATTGQAGGWARARGVYAVGFDDVTVANEGAITAYASADDGRASAYGVYAFGYGAASTVTNAGDIHAGAESADGFAQATGINNIGYGAGYNDASVANEGTISATADGSLAYAFGVLNLNRQRNGSAGFDNQGDIAATATGGYATATGALNMALRYGDATSSNAGTIEAVATGVQAGEATGLYNYALVYDAVMDNSGTIDASASGAIAIAVGAYNESVLYGAANTVNHGDIGATASGATLAHAAGIVTRSSNTAYLDNYGNVDVVAEADAGEATAAGLYALSDQTTRVRNYGAVSASAQDAGGDATAYGVFAFGGSTGSALVINGGDVAATALAGDGATAYAAGVIATADVATVFNDAGIRATASAGTGGTAYALGARAYGENSGLYTYGDITAVANADAGSATAIGAHAYGYQSAGFLNAGDIQSTATAEGGTASATGAYSLGVIYGAYATNSGSISTAAIGDSATATGLSNAAIYLGDAITTNSGDIGALAEGGVAPYGEAEAFATGAYNFSLFYASTIDNSGTISATATATADMGGTDGFLQAKAIGAQAANGNGYLDALVTNAGGIAASATVSQGYAAAWAAVARSSGVYGGAAVIRNDGSLQAYGHADVGVAYATGAYATNQAGDANVLNYGDVAAIARVESGRGAGTSGYGVLDYVYATGIAVKSTYGGNANVANEGAVEAHASALGAITGARGIQAYGNYASVANAEGASIVATGDTDLWGAGRATGIEASGRSGVDVANDGSVVAYGHSRGYSYGTYETHYSVASTTGVYAGAGFYGSVSVANNGHIAATSVGDDSITFFNGGAGATGIDTYAKYGANVVNAGDIDATAGTELGIASAYGVIGHGKYSTDISNLAGASIVASATAGSLYSDTYGGRTFAAGIRVFGSGMHQGSIYNAGSIAAIATVTPDGGANASRSIATAYGVSVGAYSSVLAGAVVNRGDIAASASADFGYATAYGSFVQTQYHSDTSNDGTIAASASAAAGDAWAVGSFGFSQHGTLYVPCVGYDCDYANATYTPDGGETTLANSGDIKAIADAAGGTAHGYGAVAIGAFAAGITNTGHIGADAAAGAAFAYGALVNSPYGTSTLGNAGDIAARATGDHASAIGVSVIAHGDGTAAVENSGTIAAAAYGADAVATAVSMESIGANTLSNAGTIGAFGDGARIAVSSSADAAATIANAGTIIGAIVTGDLADNFDNAAGATWNAVGESDFGGGDDHVVNHGSIFMRDATIRLGSYGTGGNSFDNSGLIGVSGNNTIDMDNPLPVVNDGTISFLDGTAGDVLSIAGDLGGNGAIDFDASARNQSADQLYVDGSMAGQGTQTINVHLLDTAVRAASTSIALVHVSGDSHAGDFALGEVAHASGGFLTLGFDLVPASDQAGSGGNAFSLAVDVTGLNGTGSLGAAAAPGVASLADAQIGSWRQRMGVMPEKGARGWSPWMRWFTSSGGVDARHDANFGTGGSFGFDQSNSGWELGLDFRPSDRLAFGVLLGKSDGNQRLDDDQGSDRLDGSTVGVYGTWTGDRGLYADLSYRRIDVDARLSAAGGEIATGTSADAFNVEFGVAAWTLAGVDVSPQLQYTHTRIGGFALEDAGSAFAAAGGSSSRARLGLAFERSFAANGFTLTPYGTIDAVREFAGGYGYAINGGLSGSTRTDGTSAMLELGLGASRGKLSFTAGAQWMDGGAQQQVRGGQLSMRYGW